MTIIILAFIAVIANIIMDEIRFHWKDTFGLFIKEGTKFEQWMNPSKSWTNKYISSNRILRFIFSTALVWTTDFWHFLKAIILLCVFSIYIFITQNDLNFIRYVVEVIVLAILWFIFYEGIKGIFNAICSRIKRRRENRIK